jgi:hypothetical protein
MTKTIAPLFAIPAGALAAIAFATSVEAQQSCAWSNVTNPVRQIISCGESFTVEREPEAKVTIFERANDAPPRAIELENGAILIEVTPGSQPTQIRTPHAIAAVRGTTYVVDASASRTSVFVVEGRVVVSKQADASTVSLGAGDGVDVDDGTPLAVVAWNAARVTALLARFGR